MLVFYVDLGEQLFFCGFLNCPFKNKTYIISGSSTFVFLTFRCTRIAFFDVLQSLYFTYILNIFNFEKFSAKIL